MPKPPITNHHPPVWPRTNRLGEQRWTVGKRSRYSGRPLKPSSLHRLHGPAFVMALEASGTAQYWFVGGRIMREVRVSPIQGKAVYIDHIGSADA